MKHCFTLSLLCAVLLAQGQNPFSFSNSNSKLNKTIFHSGCAVTIADMNRDGLDDIARMDEGYDLYYELQHTDRKFDSIHAVATSSSSSAWAMVVGDVDNNGVRDVAVGFGSSAKLVKPNAALTAFPISTLTNSNFFLQNMNFADPNNDGWIDIFGCNDNGTSRMWGNNGSGSYGDTTEFFDLGNPGTDGSGNYGSIWTDIDNDGDIDFYIAHCRQGTGGTDGRRLDQLFINNGNNQFVLDAAAVPGARGLRNYGMTWTSSFDDIDNDGDLDCVLTQTDVASQLFLNDGNGYFTDITANSGFVVNVTPYQSKMEDFDNDGFVDIMIAGDDSRIFRNNHNNTFTLINGVFNNNNMKSFACGDLNHDGKIDLYSSYATGYTTPSNIDDVVWMNTTNNSNHFITLDLVGTVKTRDALGARVEVYGAWGKQIREVRAGESYGTTNSFMCHFGLGSAAVVDSIIVRWQSGLVTHLYNRAADQFITVIEGQCSSPDNIITAAGPLVLCTGQSLTMSAPAGYTYLWSTGETTQNITTSTEAEYNVKVTDGGCSSISKTIKLLSNPDETPTITATGTPTFCEGATLSLQSTPALSYTWSNGATSQNIVITQGGTYTLTVQGACATFTSQPFTANMIPSHVVNPDTVSVCEGTSATINVTGSGTSYWFDAASGGNLVHTGNSYTTPSLSNPTIYYVESHDSLFGLGGEVGPISNAIGGGSYYNGDQAEIFDVMKPLILRTVKVYSNSNKVRTIELRNSGGTVLHSLAVNIDTGTHVIVLNWQIDAGTGYELGWLNNSSPDLYRNSSGANYPYTINNLISVTGNTASDLARWYCYYDWHVEEVPLTCISIRNPIVANIKPRCCRILTERKHLSPLHYGNSSSGIWY